MDDSYIGPDRREFLRLEYAMPLAYKVCKQETISKLLEGYTVNISEAGLLCNIKDKVNLEDILWLSFDKGILIVCEEIESRSLIYQNGVIGKVVRIQENKNGTFAVGVKFLIREEKNLTNIYPRIHFQETQGES